MHLRWKGMLALIGVGMGVFAVIYVLAPGPNGDGEWFSDSVAQKVRVAFTIVSVVTLVVVLLRVKGGGVASTVKVDAHDEAAERRERQAERHELRTFANQVLQALGVPDAQVSGLRPTELLKLVLTKATAVSEAAARVERLAAENENALAVAKEGQRTASLALRGAARELHGALHPEVTKLKRPKFKDMKPEELLASVSGSLEQVARDRSEAQLRIRSLEDEVRVRELKLTECCTEREDLKSLCTQLRTEIAELREKLAAAIAQIPPEMPWVQRLTAAFASLDTALTLLGEIAQSDVDSGLARRALLLMPDGADLTGRLLQEAEVQLTQAQAGGSEAQCKVAAEPLLTVAAFVAESLNQALSSMAQTLGDISYWPGRRIEPRLAGIMLGARMLSGDARFGDLDTPEAYIGVLDNLPDSIRLGIAQETSLAECAMALFGITKIRRAVLRLEELAAFNEEGQPLRSELTGAPTVPEDDPRGFGLKQWILLNHAPDQALFAEARRLVHVALGLNEGRWRKLWIALVGSKSEAHNHQVERLDGVRLLGYDPRNLLLFFDLSDEELGHAAALSDLVEPDRERPEDLEAYGAFFEGLIRKGRDADRIKTLMKHFASHADRVTSRINRARQPVTC